MIDTFNTGNYIENLKVLYDYQFVQTRRQENILQLLQTASIEHVQGKSCIPATTLCKIATSSLSCLDSASAAPTAADAPLALSLFNLWIVAVASDKTKHSLKEFHDLI